MLSDPERRRQIDSLITHLYEEVAELSRAIGGHKRHVFRQNPLGQEAAAMEEGVDIIKTTIAIMQLFDIKAVDWHRAFLDKTAAIAAKARAERLELEVNTKVIGVDLDDILADLEPLRQRLGGIDAFTTEEFKSEFYRNGGFRGLEPKPGAAEGLAALRDLGWKLVIVTARPQWQYKRLHSDTVYWLEKHKMVHDMLIFSRKKVQALYDHIAPAWPRFFLEDLPRNALELADQGINVLLLDCPHNQGISAHPRIKRVYGWAEIVDTIGA